MYGREKNDWDGPTWLRTVGRKDLAVGYKKMIIERAVVRSAARVSRSSVTVIL